MTSPAIAALALLALIAACHDATDPRAAPGAGSISVTAATAGEDPDGDGYYVTVDSGQAGRKLAPNSLVVFNGVPTGTHDVRLDGVATNCAAVGGELSRRVSVTAAQATAVGFAIACVPRVGRITVQTLTTGTDLQTSGYQLQLDDSTGIPVGSNDTVTFTGVREGPHTVQLGGLAANCAVVAPNPRLVPVAFEFPAATAFTVTCVESGTLQVTVSTSGPDADPAGHIVRLERNSDSTLARVPIDGTASLPVAPGSYRVSVRPTANCEVAAQAPGITTRQVDVATRETVAISFDVTCARASQLAFVRGGQIHLVNTNGTGVLRLTDGPDDADPAWSPDGRRIAFSRRVGADGRDVYIMDANGTNLRRRAHAGYNAEPAWSPDGKRIAFTCSPGTGSVDVCAINADGLETTPALLARSGGWDAQPAWSPDGRTIAFVSDSRFYDFVYDVYLMNADGWGVKPLLEGPYVEPYYEYYFQPAWSPDGRALAIVVCPHAWENCYPNSAVAVVNADGKGLRILAQSGSYSRPTWSPDGRTIAFSSSRCRGCASSIRYVRADSSQAGLVVKDGRSPAWRP